MNILKFKLNNLFIESVKLFVFRKEDTSTDKNITSYPQVNAMPWDLIGNRVIRNG